MRRASKSISMTSKSRETSSSWKTLGLEPRTSCSRVNSSTFRTYSPRRAALRQRRPPTLRRVPNCKPQKLIVSISVPTFLIVNQKSQIWNKAPKRREEDPDPASMTPAPLSRVKRLSPAALAVGTASAPQWMSRRLRHMS